MSSTYRIKQRYDLPSDIKTRQAIANIIRAYVDGGNDLINAVTRLSEYMHNPQTRPERDSLEAVKSELDDARTRLGDVFLALDDAVEAASDALEILAALIQRGESRDPVLRDVHDWLQSAVTQLDAPLRLTSGRAGLPMTGRETAASAPVDGRIFLPAPDAGGAGQSGKQRRPTPEEWARVDFRQHSEDIAAELGVSVQSVNRHRLKLAPDVPRAPRRARAKK